MNPSHLLYVSDAAGPTTDTDLAVILDACRERNAERGITGLLLYSGGHFLQLLEGGEAALGVVFDRISHDPRHHNVQRLAFERAGQRIFPQWRMGLLNLENASLDRHRLKPLAEAVRQSRGAARGAAVIAVLRDFRDQLPATDGRDAKAA